MEETKVEVQPSSNLTFSTGKNTFSVSGSKLLVWLFVVVLGFAIGFVTYDEYGTRPTQKNLVYYQYKAVQYQGVLQNLMSQFANVNPETYNQLAKGLNAIGEMAAKVGEPVEGDRNAGRLYLLDSSIIEKPVLPILPIKEEVTNEDN